MADQSLAVQAGIKAALVGSSAVVALVGSRVYDRPPASRDLVWPYVTIGEGSTTDDGAECNEGEEVVFNLNVYSRGSTAGGFGMVEARRIAYAIKAALHEQDIALPDPDVHLVDLRFRDATFRLEPDGETRRGILQYVALTEPTADDPGPTPGPETFQAFDGGTARAMDVQLPAVVAGKSAVIGAWWRAVNGGEQNADALTLDGEVLEQADLRVWSEGGDVVACGLWVVPLDAFTPDAVVPLEVTFAGPGPGRMIALGFEVVDGNFGPSATTGDSTRTSGDGFQQTNALAVGGWLVAAVATMDADTAAVGGDFTPAIDEGPDNGGDVTRCVLAVMVPEAPISPAMSMTAPGDPPDPSAAGTMLVYAFSPNA